MLKTSDGQKLEGCIKLSVRVGLQRGVPLIAALVLFIVVPGRGADWPARPIHIVAPFGPAGAADLVNYLSAQLKQSARQGTFPGYASYGIGTLGHLVAEVAMQHAGVRMSHIPYNTAALPDIIAGRVPLASYAWSSVIGQVQAGALRAIAVSTATRQPDFPDVPTFREQGFDIVASAWFALSAPACMPHEIVERHNYEIYRIMERPDVRVRFAQNAIGFKSMTSDELTKLLATEIARWARWYAIPPSNAAKFALMRVHGTGACNNIRLYNNETRWLMMSQLEFISVAANRQGGQISNSEGGFHDS